MTLARGLTDRAATDLSAELNRHGIAVTRNAEENDRYSLAIAESAVPDAWEAHTPQCRQPEPESKGAPALLATREAELRERETSLEARLGAALQKLPNVRSASVLLTLPRPSNKLDDLLHPPAVTPPHAVVSLVCTATGTCPSTTQLLPLLTAAVPGLTPANLRVLTQLEAAATESACAELGRIGPLTVTRASLPTLKLWLATSLILHMLGSLALLVMFQRKRRAKDAHDNPQ